MANTSLEKAVMTGKPNALSLVKTLLNTPTLIYTGNGTSKIPYAVQLEVETYKQSGSAQVSESLVIAQNSKKYLTDNVAPGCWTWTMSGYIPGNTLFEKTCIFTPFVTFHTELIKNWYKHGYLLTFKDINCNLYKYCVIQSLDVVTQKDVRNKTPFTMVLKEINVMEEEEEKKGIKKWINKLEGGSLGATMAMGAVMGAASITASAAEFGDVCDNLLGSFWRLT